MMDIISKQANQFAENFFSGGFSDNQEILNAAKKKIFNLNQMDKIKFLEVILTKNNVEYEKHKLVCKEPENCPKNYEHESINYFLTQELNKLGVHLNEDTFTEIEKQEAESKLERIISDLDDLKLGQQILYEDITKEINELKELYFLGKKKWYQLLIGKSVEMVASGVVSETVAKQIVDVIKNSYPHLLS